MAYTEQQILEILGPDIGNRTISYSWARNLHSVSTQTRTIAEAFSIWTKHAVGAKSAAGSIVPAVMSTSKRQGVAVEANVLLLDLDRGPSWPRIVERLRGLGWACCAYTTASHGATATDVLAATLEAWKDHLGDALSLGAAASRYLIEVLGHDPAVALGGVRVEKVALTKPAIERKARQTTVEVYRLTHRPITKVRIVFPLEKPWLAKNYDEYRLAKSDFSDLVMRLGTAVGLEFDRSCSNPNSLFFLPTIPDNKGRAESIVLAGKLLDPAGLPPAAPRTWRWHPDGARKRAKSREMPAVLIATDRDGKEDDLAEWFTGPGRRFALLDALEDAGAETTERAESAGHHHFQCPRVGYHTNGRGDGFFVEPAGIKKSWHAYCCHDSCQDEHDLSFIAAWIESGVLTWADHLRK